MTAEEKHAAKLQRRRELRAANPEKARAYAKAWCAANPERVKRYHSTPKLLAREREKYHLRRAETAGQRALDAEWRRRTAAARKLVRMMDRAVIAKQRETTKAWMQANRERSREHGKAWRQRNPEKIIARDRARYIKRRKAKIARLMSMQAGLCAYCRADLRKLQNRKIHIDHRIPRCDGGSNKIENLQLTCEPCNLAKYKMPHEKFVLRFGRLI